MPPGQYMGAVHLVGMGYRTPQGSIYRVFKKKNFSTRNLEKVQVAMDGSSGVKSVFSLWQIFDFFFRLQSTLDLTMLDLTIPHF